MKKFQLLLAVFCLFSEFTSIAAKDLNLPGGIIFRIRILNVVAEDLSLQPVTPLKNGAEAGAWTNYPEAEKNKLVLIAQGYNEVEIVAYQDHKKIPLETARKITGHNTTETIPVNTLDSLLNSAYKNLYITISSEDLEILKKMNLRLTMERSASGSVEYRWGKFESIEEAETHLSLLKGVGIKSARIGYSL